MGTAVIERTTPVTTSSSRIPNSVWYVLRLLAVAVVDVFALLLGVNIFQDGNVFLAVAIGLAALVVSVINFRQELWPLRWISPALALLILLTIYPLLYTVYIAFTNFSDGHQFTKAAAVERLTTGREYLVLAEGAASYSWELFQNDAGEFALWLTAEDGSMLFAPVGITPETVTPNESGEAPFSDDGIPAAYNGFRLLDRGERTRALSTVTSLQFGAPEQPIGIRGRTEAGVFISQWTFDEASNTLTNIVDGKAYPADDGIGNFVAADGTLAPLGYWVPVGLDNFTRIFNSPLIGGPLIRVFLWTIGFALLSVASAFAVGLTVSLILNTNFRGVRLLRSLLFIPYAIPGMIGILIWRGMLNEEFGILSRTMEGAFGWAPPFLSDAGWAKFSILLVNLWFAYPYFMLICSGALQSIPSSIYEAAEVDGATPWHKFWNLTLPLLLVAVGPLLIASFIFNFNNFLLLEALNQGGPTIAGTAAPPVGHTDNLMTYTFRLAFSAGGTRDFGFASSIAVVIFFIVGTLTLVQFRLTRRWEEVSESV